MSSGGASNVKASKAEQPAHFPVGKRLKAQRMKLGWDLHDVAAWLRIRESYLVAFEEGHLDDLPSGVYVLGFLRSYARALGLDADDIVSEFQAVIPVSKMRSPALNIPEPLMGRSVPVGIWAGIGLILIFIAYTGIYHYAGDDNDATRDKRAAGLAKTVPKDAGLSPEIAAVMPEPPAPVLPVEKSALATPATQNVATEPKASDPSKMSESQAVSTGEESAQPDTSSSVAMGVTAPATPELAKVGQHVQSEKSSALLATSPQSSTEVATSFELVASHNTWVRVTNRDGQDICNRVLKPGETCSGQREMAPFRITTGNAGGIAFRFGGAVTAPLGESGQVIRDLILTAGDIAEGRAPGNAKPATPDQDAPESVTKQNDSPPMTSPNAGAGADRATDGTGSDAVVTPLKTHEDEVISRPDLDLSRATTASSSHIKAVKQAKAQRQSESDRLNERQLGQIRAQVSPE